MCLECDEKGGFEIEEHKKDHSLARCLHPHNDAANNAENSTVVLTERVSSLEVNIQLMNDRLLQVETNVQTMNERQMRVEANVQTINERQERLENLLRSLLDYVQGSPALLSTR